MQASSPGEACRYVIDFPECEGADQDEERCEVDLDGERLALRLHDYDQIYRLPGLYEQLFYDRLRCMSPRQVADLLAGSLRSRAVEPSSLTAIDVGAGNGMVGDELRRIGIGDIVAVDILPEAAMAAQRDRPGLYCDYVVADLTRLTPDQRQRLERVRPGLLVTVAALGFGDIPPLAFATAFNLVATGGWLAFNIRDAFLETRDRSGFSVLISAMTAKRLIVVDSWKRYVHRLSVAGEPIEYIAIVARKLGDVPDSMVAHASGQTATISASPATSATPTTRAHIELRRVTKRYVPGDPAVLDGLDLAVPRGELLALVGESGSGKTTALKLINRLIEPTDGEVLIDGSSVRDQPQAQLRRSIGYVFQQAGLFPHMTVGDNVAVTPRLLGWPARDIASRVDELLSLVGLDPDSYRLRRPSELSGGQQQRVAFARALAARPRVLLLDEPFSALDPMTRADLQREFALIHRQLDLTTVLVTHDMAEAILLADRIAVLRGGRLHQIGTPRELASADDPYVATLLATPRRQAADIERIAGGVTTPQPLLLDMAADMEERR